MSVENQLCPIGDGASFRHDALKDEAKLVNSVQILAGNTFKLLKFRRIIFLGGMIWIDMNFFL